MFLKFKKNFSDGFKFEVVIFETRLRVKLTFVDKPNIILSEVRNVNTIEGPWNQGRTSSDILYKHHPRIYLLPNSVIFFPSAIFENSAIFLEDTRRVSIVMRVFFFHEFLT